MSEDEMKETLAELPFVYKYEDVSCTSGDAVAGIARGDRASVEFLIVASDDRDLGCDRPVPGGKGVSDGLTTAISYSRRSENPKPFAQIAAQIDCAILEANGIENCGFPE